MGARRKEEIRMNRGRERWTLTEDWWSVVIGLALVLLVWLGVLGKVPWPLFGLLN